MEVFKSNADAIVRISTLMKPSDPMLLVHTLERRNGLALIFVQRGANDLAVLELNVGRIDVVLEGEGMLHPFLVVTLYHFSVRYRLDYFHRRGLTSGKSSRA